MNVPMKGRASALAGVMLLAALARAQQPAASAKDHGKPAAAPNRSSPTDPGDRKFQTNCGRCHEAPEQLSNRIAGTVVLHMRVRASLTAQDERDILRFLAP